MKKNDKVKVMIEGVYVSGKIKSITPKTGYKNWIYNVMVVEIEKKLYNFNEWDVIEDEK